MNRWGQCGWHRAPMPLCECHWYRSHAMHTPRTRTHGLMRCTGQARTTTRCGTASGIRTTLTKISMAASPVSAHPPVRSLVPARACPCPSAGPPAQVPKSPYAHMPTAVLPCCQLPTRLSVDICMHSLFLRCAWSHVCCAIAAVAQADPVNASTTTLYLKVRARTGVTDMHTWMHSMLQTARSPLDILG